MWNNLNDLLGHLVSNIIPVLGFYQVNPLVVEQEVVVKNLHWIFYITATAYYITLRGFDININIPNTGLPPVLELPVKDLSI